MPRVYEDEIEDHRARRRVYEDEVDQAAQPTILSSLHKGLLESTTRPYAQPGSVQENPDFQRPEWAPPLLPQAPPPGDPGSDIAQPETLAQKVAYDVGNYAPMLAGGLAVAPVMAPAMAPGAAVGAEALYALLGLTAARKTEEKGGGPILQTAADMLASASPAMIVSRSGPKIVGRLARRSEPGAEEASSKVIEYLNSRGVDLKHGLANRPADPTDAYEAALALERQFPAGVEEGGKYKRLALGRIEEAQADFPDPLRQPSLAQSTDELGGYNVSKRELQYAKSDPDFSRAEYGRRLETIEDVNARYLDETPQFAGYEATRTGAQTIIDDAAQAEAAAWRAVPIDEMPTAPSQPLKDAVAEIANESEVGKRYLPREAKTIMRYSDTVPFSELQALSSELKTTIRIGESAGVMNEVAYRRAGRAKKILPAVEDLIRSVGDPGDVASLLGAREATYRLKRLNTEPMRAILNRGDPVDVLNTLRRSDDIGPATRELVEVLSEQEGAIGGLQDAAWTEIFGEALGSRNPRQMNATVNSRKNRPLYEALFAPEQREIIDRTIRRQRRSTSGIAGTSAQSRATGTGYQTDQADLLSAFEESRKRGTWTGMASELARQGFRRLGNATPQSLAIEKLAATDLELARLLLSVPTPEQLPALRAAWNAAISKAERRAPELFRVSEAVVRGATREDIEMLKKHFAK